MDNLRGAMWMVISMAGFAVEDVFVKAASAGLPTSQILMMIGFGGALVFWIWCRLHGQPVWTRDLTDRAVILRNLTEMTGTLSIVSAIVLLPLATVSAVFQATPLVVTMGAALFLGAEVGWRRWTAMAVGFLGVLIVIRPGSDAFEPASLLAVAATVLLGARDLATREVPSRIGSMQLSAYGFASAGLAGVLLLPFGAPIVVPDARDWAMILSAVAFGVGGYYAIVVAMRIGEVAAVTPFRYTRLLFAIVLGFFVFGHVPDEFTLIGAALILGSGLYTLWRERQGSRHPVAAEPAVGCGPAR